MALNFTRWNDSRTGKPIAEIRVRHFVSRDDLVGAVVQIAYDRAEGSAMTYPEPEDIERLLASVTARQVENTVADLYRERGVMFGEMGVSDSVGPGFYDTALPFAEAVVCHLYPHL